MPIDGGTSSVERLQLEAALATKKEFKIGRPRQCRAPKRVIDCRIVQQEPISGRQDMTDKLRRRVVQDHDVGLATHRSAEESDAAKADVETVGGARTDLTVEQNPHVHVAVPVRAPRRRRRTTIS